MTYQALARKWRPQTFRDVIGQDTVVRTLKNAIEQQRIHHAYLFSGVRGVGKTTAARIFAKAINCVKGPTSEPCNECTICREITEGIDMDVREIDAATYTQVDNIRELREVTQFQPARDRKRIFIIDEAHMLSSGAWNALLKLIEEPPPHVAFIMATTEMQKVPATILSRVQRFVFARIGPSVLVERLEEICQAENIEIDREALEMIARRGEGSVRDALSILDQIVAFSGKRIGVAEVSTVLGLSDTHFFARIADSIRSGDHGALLESLEEAGEAGRDFKLLYRDFLSFLRNVMLLTSGAPETMLSLPADELQIIRGTAADLDYADSLRVLNLLIRDEEIISKAEHQRLAVEISLLKAATLPRLRAVEDVLSSGNRGEAPHSGGPVVSQRKAASPARAAAVRQPAQEPAASEPSEERRQAAAPGAPGTVSDVVSAVVAERRMTGSYLEQAAASRMDGDTITFEFDPGQKFAADYVSEGEQLRFIEKAAQRIHGRPISVRVATRSPKAEPEKGGTLASQLQQDPLLQAFTRHLGGEVVARKGKNRTESA